MVLKLRGSPPDWSSAACRDTAPHREPGEEEVYDPWFDELEPEPAMSVCNGDTDGFVCPLRDECARFALFNNEKSGVWGGMTEEDRKLTRRLWRWKASMTEPHPEWRYRTHDELVALRDDMLRRGETNTRQLEENDEED